MVTVRRLDGRVTHRRLRLVHGTVTTMTDFSPARVRSVVVTLVNVSTRYACHRGTLLSCGGMPRDDGRLFTVTARVTAP